MARSPLTETIYRVQGMIAYVRENLSTDEFMLFLDLLVPEPVVEPVKPARKKRKPRVAKSQRAASLAEQIRATSKARDSDSDPNAHCQKAFPGGFVCDEAADANVHRLRGVTGYHEFEVGARNVVGEAGTGIQTADIGPLP